MAKKEGNSGSKRTADKGHKRSTPKKHKRKDTGRRNSGNGGASGRPIKTEDHRPPRDD